MAMIVMISAFSFVLISRTPLELDGLRARGMLFQEVPGGYVQNIYTLKVLNMDKQDRVYSAQVTGLSEYRLDPDEPIFVPALIDGAD